MLVRNLNQKNKYLIIQTAFIGDVILATSLIKQLSVAEPDADIHFLLRKGNQGLLEQNKRISKIHIWDKSQKVRSLFKCIKEIRAQKYDYVINVQRFFNSGLVTTLSAAKVKVGFDKNPLSLFFTYRIKHLIPDLEADKALHEVERNAKLLGPLKIIPNEKKPRPEIFFTNEEEKKVKSLIDLDHKFIVMAPSSVWFTKALGREKWIELIKNLIDYKIYCIGAPSDYDFVQSLIQSQHHAINLCGKLSLTESAYLMSLSQWVMVNDSAPLHLASSVNAKTIAFFCSTVKEFGYTPLSDTHHIIEVNNLDCRPCGLHGKNECPLGHFKCSKNIDLNRVVQITHQ